MALEQLGQDMLLVDGDFSPLPMGDVETCAGLRCLAQDLVHRLATPRGDLWMHPDYGCDVYRFLHLESTPLSRLDFCQSVAEEVSKDPRVIPGTATCEVVSWDLSRVTFRVSVQPISVSHPLNLVLGYDLKTGLEVVRG